MNILIIAPHPDDELLGCGGTIIKYKEAGYQVYLCIMTKGDEEYYGKEVLEEKRKEAERVAEFLGIRKVFFCNFVAAHLDTYPQNQINQKLREIIQEIEPNIIFLPHQGDLHKDHQLTFQCSLVAAKPILNPYIQKILSYESLSETEQSSPHTRPFIPTIYIDISRQLSQKLEVLALYKSEIKSYPHPRSLQGVEIKAQARGLEIGVSAAEAFMLIKEIQ